LHHIEFNNFIVKLYSRTFKFRKVVRQQTRKCYNCGPTGSHTLSIERRHFQRLWTTPNPDYKVVPLS